MCLAAVRMGNLAKFNQVLEEFGEKFQVDGTYTLIIRLRHNVIKTGGSPGSSTNWFSVMVVVGIIVGFEVDL